MIRLDKIHLGLSLQNYRQTFILEIQKKAEDSFEFNSDSKFNTQCMECMIKKR